MHHATYPSYRDLFAGVPKPFAYVDLDRLDTNVQKVLDYSGDKSIRVASKSIRSVSMLRHILDQSPRFVGLMCFTAEEAVFLSTQGFDDLLIAYPTWEPTHIQQVAERVRAGCQISLMVDSLDHITHIKRIAQSEGVQLPLCIDLDMSTSPYNALHFGVWRSSIRSADQISALVQAIQSSNHLILDGLMGYEAQIAGVTDASPGSTLMNSIKRHLKARSLPVVAQRRAALVAAVLAAGGQPRVVNGGGTGSLKTSSADPSVTEVTAGSAFYAPGLFTQYKDYDYSPAAGFVLEVVRQPSQDIFTCLGGGYIASGDAGPDRLPQPYLPQGATLMPFEGAGEVQTPIHYRGPEALTLGSPIFMRHAKAGELCEHFNELILIRDGEIVDRVKTYRGEGCCFL
ncbi:MAG: amino acid deaminase/aldolase [Chloroflexi bacterium]|nr:amino acid deaminase/aldolase [Chloroflexota bacterium]